MPYKLVFKDVFLRTSISNTLMNSLPAMDSDSPKPKGEELPVEEFESVPDWNAEAWRRIQARDAQALEEQMSLTKSLSGYSMAALDSAYIVLNRTKQNHELRDAIAAEIEHRVDSNDTDTAVTNNLI